MALAPGHRLGQIIGEVLERTLEPQLARFARRHGLFLDKKGPRKTRGGKKLTWSDGEGNRHDLDFVLERGGSEENIGDPIAFIEISWRRYTRHSKNKAQEIQGAILPLAQRFRHLTPFIGTVLAGKFTDAATDQLKSLGFHVLHFPYRTVLDAFAKSGIDINFDERTSDPKLRKKVASFLALDHRGRGKIIRSLASIKQREISEFIAALEATVTRKITLVRIVPLHGKSVEFRSVSAAINYISRYRQARRAFAFLRYDLSIRYSNGDQVRGEYSDREEAMRFLRALSG